jgi:DNA uptake protein ComE-like DNA-binding protein
VLFLTGAVLYFLSAGPGGKDGISFHAGSPSGHAVSAESSEYSPAAVSITGRLDLNTASAEELEELPVLERFWQRALWTTGIDTALLTLEDLLDVPGIGESTLEKIYEYMDG